MIKKLMFICLISVFIMFSKTTHAHILKIDKDIGITMHIDPDDEPVANKESLIYVDIEDKSKKFDKANPSNCECILIVKQNDQELTRLPITYENNYNQLRYVFKNSGIYTLEVSGKPKNPFPGFQEFNISFEYYVKDAINTTTTSDGNKNLLASYFIYIVLISGIIIIYMWIRPFDKYKEN